MIEQLINALSGAFTQVIDLVSGFIGTEEGGVFGAIAELSSNVFGA